MALEIFKLVGSIFVDNEAANESIAKTDKKAGGVAETFAKGVGTAAKWGTAIVAGAGAAAVGLTAFATKSASTADNIDKMSQRLGISREAFQELDFVLSQSGVDINSFQTGAKSLLANMDKVTEGNQTAIDNFNALGVSVQNANGSLRSQEEVLFDTIAAFQGMEDSAEKSRLAQELFGKQGQEILPLLNSEAGSLEEMKQQAHELGLILSDEMIDSGVELTDSLDQTKRAFGSIITQLGGALMPIVVKVSEYIQKGMPKIQAVVKKIEPVLTKLFDSLLPPLMDLIEQLLPPLLDLIEQLLPPISDILSQLIPFVVSIIQQLMPVLMEVIQAVMPVLLELIEKLLPPLMQLIDELMPVLVEVLEMILPLLEPIMELLEPILDLIITLLPPLLQLVQLVLPLLTKALTLIIEKCLKVLQPIIEWLAEFLGDVLVGVIEWLKISITAMATEFVLAWELIKKAWEVASGFFSDIWDGISKAFSGVAEWFGGIFSDAYDKITEFFSPLTKFFEGIWEDIRGIFDKVGQTVADAVGGTVSEAINTVLKTATDIINKFITSINGAIKIINKTPGINISTLDKLEVPQMATGGVLEKGQVGFLEGDGAEAVVPLEKNTKWINRVAEQMESVQSGGKVTDLLEAILAAIVSLDSNMGGNLADALNNSSLKVNDRELIKIVTNGISRQQADLGRVGGAYV